MHNHKLFPGRSNVSTAESSGSRTPVMMKLEFQVLDSWGGAKKRASERNKYQEPKTD